MMSFWERRRARRAARDMLQHARHVRHMYEDIADPDALGRLRGASASLTQAVQDGSVDSLGSLSEEVSDAIAAIVPKRSHRGLRENLEVLLVAVAVAMAFRTYFLQPFKIPTGSMQPTLYGIHAEVDNAPAWMRAPALKPLRWLVRGEWPFELRAQSSGVAIVDSRVPEYSPDLYVYIGNAVHRIPRTMQLHFSPGDRIIEGQLLASGVQVTGDHIFVDKVRWHFCRPNRGEIMVFSTSGMTNITPNTHYIKRLVGLPGDTLSITPPNLLVNGAVVESIPGIRRVADAKPGSQYAGYQLGPLDASYLRTPTESIDLRAGEYFGLGDNTRNSRDCRYFGPVPERNMVGPALLV